MDREVVKTVEDIYRDPNQAVSRYGAKAHADLVIIELALLHELRITNELIRKALLEPKVKKAR